MKCDECVYNATCWVTHGNNSEACQDFLSPSLYKTTKYKLESLLSYITDGKYSESSYTIEEMKTFVDDAINSIAEKETTQAIALIESYKDDIINLRREIIDLKDIIVKMVMERMETK